MYLQTRFTPNRLTSRPANFGRSLAFAVLVASVGGTGCRTGYYEKWADKETYRIIQQAEQDVFGRTNDFTINTPYSSRKPAEIAPEEIIQQRQTPGTLILTLEEALKVAVQNSREYQSEKERLYLTALSLTGARHQFTPHFFAGASQDWTRDANGDISSREQPRMGLSQFFQSGASLGLTLANDFLRYYTGDPSRSAASSISVNIMQPLLRGFGRSVNAESLKQAERNVIYAIRAYSQYQRQFAVDIVNAYFALLQNKDQLINAYNDYQRRLETIQYTEARGEAGRQSQLDVDEARTEELTAKNSYIQAATTYLNNLDRFKITLGLPLTTKLQLDDAPLKELRQQGLTLLALDRERALAVAIEHHLELLNEIDRFEDSQRKIKVAANRLRPDLNVFADASLDSQRPNDYTQFRPDEIRTSAGIELDLPLNRLSERNDYRASLVSFQSALRTLGRQLDTKKDEIDRGLRNLESSRRSYFIQTNAVAIAERRVEGEQLSLQAGRRTVRNVRDAQDVLVRSQNALTAAMVNHLSARLQLLLDLGVLDTGRQQFWSRADAVTVPLAPESAPLETEPPPADVVPPEAILQM